MSNQKEQDFPDLDPIENVDITESSPLKRRRSQSKSLTQKSPSKQKKASPPKQKIASPPKQKIASPPKQKIARTSSKHESPPREAIPHTMADRLVDHLRKYDFELIANDHDHFYQLLEPLLKGEVTLDATINLLIDDTITQFADKPIVLIHKANNWHAAGYPHVVTIPQDKWDQLTEAERAEVKDFNGYEIQVDLKELVGQFGNLLATKNISENDILRQVAAQVATTEEKKGHLPTQEIRTLIGSTIANHEKSEKATEKKRNAAKKKAEKKAKEEAERKQKEEEMAEKKQKEKEAEKKRKEAEKKQKAAKNKNRKVVVEQKEKEKPVPKRMARIKSSFLVAKPKRTARIKSSFNYLKKVEAVNLADRSLKSCIEEAKENDQHLQIKRSTVHGLGRGLFVKKSDKDGPPKVKFRNGDILTQYVGYRYFEEDVHKIYKNMAATYAITLEDPTTGKLVVIDAEGYKTPDESKAAYANDCTSDLQTTLRGSRLDQCENNVIFFEKEGQVFLKAITNIYEGGEIFCSYGNKYFSVNDDVKEKEEKNAPTNAHQEREATYKRLKIRLIPMFAREPTKKWTASEVVDNLGDEFTLLVQGKVPLKRDAVIRDVLECRWEKEKFKTDACEFVQTKDKSHKNAPYRYSIREKHIHENVRDEHAFNAAIKRYKASK